MDVPAHIFREYDIRGLAEEELNTKNVRAIGHAFGTILRKNGVRLATVGGDVRSSSPRIMADIAWGLNAAGLDVTDIGTVMTPTFYYSLYSEGVGGGVMVTGSHNPKEFNGLKLALGKATLYGQEIQEVLSVIKNDGFFTAEESGSLGHLDVKPAYLEMLAERLKLGPRKLNVVADAGNGTASLFIEPFLRKLGVDYTLLFATPDGRFPNHHPDPVKRENLVDLIRTVRETGADLGVGFDGDADRIGVVDEKGEVIWGDILMALYWQEILPKHPGAEAIVEVKSSQALVDEIRRLGGKPVFWKAGHSLIKAKMRELKALFAGEVSGHMFFADEFFGFDDSFYAAGRLMRILSNTDKSLSELVAPLPHYHSTAETRIDCADEIKFGVIESIREAALKDHEAITVDGVRILYPEGWGLVRASNTQPVIVARVEGRTPEALQANMADLKARIRAAGVGEFDWEF
jgi:phosphomannomutase/phosphoglucomutase